MTPSARLPSTQLSQVHDGARLTVKTPVHYFNGELMHASQPLQLDELFSETEYLGPSPLDFCASQPLAIKYVWAITFEWQAYHLLK